MPIISSTYTVGHAQASGLHYVTETHTWDTGEVSRLEYGPLPSKTDFQSIANARAQQIEADRIKVEAEKIEKEAADAKLATVIDAAVKAGTLTKEDIEKTGLSVDPATVEETK